jgi:uncharacterized membrane protein
MQLIIIQHFILSALIFVLLDMAYFKAVAIPLFQRVVLNVQKEPLQLNLTGAIVAYLILIFGLNFFILNETETEPPLWHAFLLGFIIYGTYEATNYALLKNWSLLAVLIDTVWGGILFALTTFLVRRIRHFF